MSLFKSLQHIPGVITIFHLPHNNQSIELLKILNKHQVSSAPISTGKSWLSRIFALNPGQDKDKSTKAIDEILFRDSDGLKVSNDFKNALYYIDIQNKFPTSQQFKLIFDYARKDPENLKAYESVFPKLINKESSGALILPESSILKNLALKPIIEVPKGSFDAPLVVDWSKCKIRNEAKGLEEILEEYKA
ncbi:hypothetical protein DASC09_049390 [Saccharomycopsis crataegensis]|uniref:Uncharacterized protein n=1 Tax=Saccharomycopsis crataegensis TaxID=43959 RepID=A0AAV5QSA6_9ASCO|nr:hypothetical protein DASC09_049390 [Saccharomycopsis crataegensis]